MSERSTIEWTNATFNPVRGCTKISPGCRGCYAATFAERFRGVAGHPYEQGFDLRLVPEKLLEPLRWLKPRMIFTNSMSDLFHEVVPDEFIRQVMRVIEMCPQHTFQMLTKRAERARAFMTEHFRPRYLPVTEKPLPPANLWVGVSIENADYQWRADSLRETPAATRFISFEPLLDDIPLTDKDLQDIDWVIVGGESGPRARRMELDWARNIRDACLRTRTPLFFKQHGAFHPETGKRVGKKKAGRVLDGREWNQFPTKVHFGNHQALFRSEAIEDLRHSTNQPGRNGR